MIPQAVSLHRYFIWANRMRLRFEAALQNGQGPGNTFESAARWFSSEAGMYRSSYWYGALYVVVEAWRELKLHDDAVDQLLKDEPKMYLLKRYRNGSFHFQPDSFHEKFTELFGDLGSAEWIGKLHDELNRFFLERPSGESV